MTFREQDELGAETNRMIRRFNTAVDEALGREWRTDLPRGCIIATARLSRVTEIRTRGDLPMDDREILFGEYAVGRFLWWLEEVEELEQTVAARGFPTLWRWGQKREPTDEMDRLM